MPKPWNTRGWEPDWRKRRAQEQAAMAEIERQERARRYGNPWRSGPRTPKANKYPGDCHKCGARIEAGAGIITKIDDQWRVAHRGECPENSGKINSK